jgi:outer membrane protein, adhesin transport system
MVPVTNLKSKKYLRTSLAVCASALMIFSFSPASAQTAQTLEDQMKADLAQASQQTVPTIDTPTPAESDLPVPTGEVSDSLNAAPLAQVPPPAPPVPVLAATNPEANLNYGSVNSSFAPTTTDRIVNIRDAVAVGVLTNPSVEAVSNNRRATDEELRQARALYAPSIDMTADTGMELTRSRPDNAADRDEELWRASAGLTLTQMLFDGYETKFENQRQKNRVRSASHRVREASEFLGLDVIESYIDVLRQRELLAIAVENVKQHQEIMVQIEDAANAGRSTTTDVEQTRARLASARANEANVRQSLRNAESNYNRRLGSLPQPDLQRPVAPKDLLSANMDEEVKRALTLSPTIDVFESDVNVADAERKQSGSTLYPQVDFQARASTSRDVGGSEGTSTGGFAGVVMNWNLFRGGGDVARTREFTYRYAQSKDQRKNAARSIENDVRQTWTSMIAAADRSEQFRQQAASNAQVVQAYKDQFNLDRRTLLDVLDSQNEWFVSRSNAINNEYLEMFAVYRLLALRGELLPSLQVAYPKEAYPSKTSTSSGS